MVIWAEEPVKKPAPVVMDKAVAPVVTERPLTSFERQRLSVERQMKAVRENFPAAFNGAPATVMSYSGTAVTPPADCPPVSAATIKPIIEREALRNKIDASLVRAVVEAESAYSPCAVSAVGAMGLMQLMPATAESLQVSDPYDPSQNITAGTQYLGQMLQRYGGDVAKALAAYNAGPARVDAVNGIPAIPETQEYVRKIMGKIAAPRPVE